MRDEESQQIYDTRICVDEDCGVEFDITVGEAQSYFRKGLDLPKRCPSCRALRRNFEDERIKCALCGRYFPFEAHLRRLFKYRGIERENKWKPTECRRCRLLDPGKRQQLEAEKRELELAGTAAKKANEYLRFGIDTRPDWKRVTYEHPLEAKIAEGKPIEHYDARGKLVARTYRVGNEIKRYDASHRLRSYRVGNVTKRYDADGKLIGISYQRGDCTVHYKASQDPFLPMENIEELTGRSYRVRTSSALSLSDYRIDHYDARSRLTGRSYYFSDRIEHYDAKGHKTGTSR